MAALLLCGCATHKPSTSSRPFVFGQDTFAYANELEWEYHVDPATGKTTHTRQSAPRTYSLHCFVVARSARQFFQFARFDEGQPVASEDTYRTLIRRVVSLDPLHEIPEKKKVVIPGYSNLYTFSAAHGSILKDECGGAWQSYFQRGNWRMIFPFSRRHQVKTAEELFASVKKNLPPVAHVVRFPSLSINHAVVLYAARETGTEIQFSVYDPNTPAKPTELVFDRATRTFSLPPTLYFAGGRVDVYHIYLDWLY